MQWTVDGRPGRRGRAAVRTVGATDVEDATIQHRQAAVFSAPAPTSTLTLVLSRCVQTARCRRVRLIEDTYVFIDLAAQLAGLWCTVYIKI